MSKHLRHALISAAIVALSLLSHGPLARAGWLGRDLDLLHAAQRASNEPNRTILAERCGWLEEGRVRPVPGLVLEAAERASSGTTLLVHRSALPLRAIAFLVLLGAAVAGGFALRRALVPWVGGDTARAAGFAFALFVGTHPLGTAAIARPAALGDLFALAFGGLAACLFLRGRQEREKRSIVVAGCAAMAAGFSSPIAVLLPVVLAGLELGSARRPRPLLDRARTAATTFVVFLACVGLESVFAAALGLSARASLTGALPELPAWNALPLVLANCIEKLGILFSPVPGRGDGPTWPDYVLCIALVLVALWPVLRSARVAPRLWGWLAIAWVIALAVALSPRALQRVAPADDSHSEILVMAMVFACAGLAVAATSLLGTRRIVLPAIIAIGLSWLGAHSASNFVVASRAVADLGARVEAAQTAGGPEAQVLVVDPPLRVSGLDLDVEPLARLVDRAATEMRAPRGVSAAALPILSRQESFASWRKHNVVVVERELDASLGAHFVARILAPTEGLPPPIRWREKGRSALFEVDPSATRTARIQALPGTSTAEAPRLRWLATEPVGESQGATGVWVEGPIAPVAIFDLADVFSWWSVPTVRRVWTEGSLLNIDSAELVDDIALPLASDAPRNAGDDWEFALAEGPLDMPVRGEAHFVLDVLELGRLAYATFDCRMSSAADSNSRVVTAPGAAGFERSLRATGPVAIAWSLERRVGDVVIARASGRR